MRSINKRLRLVEFLNYLTYHENKQLTPIIETINLFTAKTNINIPKSTAYRIIKKYIDAQQKLLNNHVNNEILKIYNE